MESTKTQYNLPRHTFFLAVVITELILFLFFLGYYYLEQKYISSVPSAWEVSRGIIIALPLIACNWFLFASPALRSRLTATYSFLDNIIYPICRSIGITKILVISILAGVCEELFFRLAFQSKFTSLASAFVYMYFHFGTASVHYRFLALSYFVIAMYLGSLTNHFNTIWPAIVAHAVLSFFSLFYIKYFYQPQNA